MEDPTPAERFAFEALQTLTKKLKRGPSLVEVAKAMGITKSGAARHLHALHDKGLITKPRLEGEWAPTSGAEKFITRSLTR
jgi:DNA-binding IclR family transcriptional regulator